MEAPVILTTRLMTTQTGRVFVCPGKANSGAGTWHYQVGSGITTALDGISKLLTYVPYKGQS